MSTTPSMNAKEDLKSQTICGVQLNVKFLLIQSESKSKGEVALLNLVNKLVTKHYQDRSKLTMKNSVKILRKFKC